MLLKALSFLLYSSKKVSKKCKQALPIKFAKFKYRKIIDGCLFIFSWHRKCSCVLCPYSVRFLTGSLLRFFVKLGLMKLKDLLDQGGITTIKSDLGFKNVKSLEGICCTKKVM